MGVSGLAAVELVSYTYDSLGRMSAQTFHNGGYNNIYGYNVRGWLTSIDGNNFMQSLTYNNGPTGFNGNITAMNWTANGSSHSYAFTYDGVNRMLNATHGTGAYTEKVTGYDKNGNITGLQRYGNGLIDNLTYTYNGNQLTKVEDATGNTAGFKNGASQANEYTYDNNGNLTKDLNKGITNISYNSLNLPKKITYSDGSSVTYLYGADGKKYRTVHVIGGVTTTTEYIGNLLYINNTPQKMLTEVGYMDLTNNAYYYYLKDHQGNNRVVINSSGTVQEVNHYYPFGSTFATSNVQPYKYNGKELDTKNGLNWYDYGARHYDAALGRWHVVDPLGEKYFGVSPYAYCLSNPIKYIDPTGCEVIATDALSRRNILNTLTKEERKYVTFDEGGILNVALLNKSSSKSDNFSALRTLANSKIKYNFIVSERDVEGELFRSNSNSYYRGLTAFPNAENKPSKDNNVWIYTSAFENELVQAENTAHEAYGHAYFYDLNQSGNKNIDFHHRYINEVGESVWDEELQMNIPTLIRVDSNEKLKEQIDRVVNQTRLNYENK